jgi:hypothetical protein
MLQCDAAMTASRLKDMVVDDPRWHGFTDLRWPSWQAHAHVVALHLAVKAWEDVSQSAMEWWWTTDGMERSVAPGGPHEGQTIIPLSPTQQASFRTMWENATTAYNVLAPLAGTQPVTGLLNEDEPNESA